MRAKIRETEACVAACQETYALMPRCLNLWREIWMTELYPTDPIGVRRTLKDECRLSKEVAKHWLQKAKHALLQKGLRNKSFYLNCYNLWSAASFLVFGLTVRQCNEKILVFISTKPVFIDPVKFNPTIFFHIDKGQNPHVVLVSRPANLEVRGSKPVC